MDGARAYSRREALALGAAALALPTIARMGSTSELDHDPFVLGVNSGDPDTESVVLWTRLTAADATPLEAGDIDVAWELAADAAFDTVIAAGTEIATAETGHSVHVVAELDGPAYYRFTTGDHVSDVGRTAPAASPGTPAGESLTLASASCQHYESGFYAAHRDIAEWAPDLVLFLGDFMYEGAGRPVADGRVRSHRGGETVTLADYRDRYAEYLADPQLRSSRAVCPWVVVWDDHELANNYAGMIPARADDAESFAQRRLAAYQAFWEHMPLRGPRPETPDLRIYRTVAWGDLAMLLMLDGRQYRDNQACGDTTMDFDPPCAEALDPQRSMLGADQEQWLLDELAGNTRRWAVIGQQTVMTDMRMPNGAILNYDQWDGYSPARERLLLGAAQTERTIVLSGDIHMSIVGTLPGVGAEFVATGLTSLSPVDPAVAEPMAMVLPDIVAAEVAHRGYIRHTVTADAWTADYRIVDDATDADSPVGTWQTFTVDADAPDVVRSASSSGLVRGREASVPDRVDVGDGFLMWS